MRVHLICALVLFAPAPWGASELWGASGLTYSTYLREGFTPAAIATDSAGNVYLAGSTSINTATSQTSATVVKLDPTGTQYLYVRTFGGSASDSAAFGGSPTVTLGAGTVAMAGTATGLFTARRSMTGVTRTITTRTTERMAAGWMGTVAMAWVRLEA